jgi:predicted RNA-binding protein
MTKYWIGVASKEHVNRGVKEGFCQLCHGKKQPLNRMKPGDWLIYYSSKVKMNEPNLCQKFTAIGQITDFQAYGNSPGIYRRTVNYKSPKSIAIRPLLPKLTFIKSKKLWGLPFRTGFFEINQQDFELISSQMLIS